MIQPHHEHQPKPKLLEALAAQVAKTSAKRRLSDIRHNRIEESGVSGSACQCQLCRFKGERDLSPQQETVVKIWEGAEERSFTWFVQQLAALSECTDFSLLIPETVIFKRSRPALILQMNKDGFLRGTSAPEKIKKEEIIRNFTNIVRTRKRDEVTATPLVKSGKTSKSMSDPGGTGVYGKEIALIRYFTKGFDNEGINLRPQDEEGPVRVTLESEFFEMMFERGGSSLWKSLVYIQTVLKSKVGLNEVMYATYDSSVSYKLAPIESLDNLLKKYPEHYCQNIMRKVAKAFKDYVRYEICSMECEFVRDDNGAIWLYYVRKLFVRQLPEAKVTKQTDESLQEQQERKGSLLEHIWSVGQNSPTNTNTARLMSLMQDQFEEVKAKTGIVEALRQRPKDNESIAAYSRLRPRARYSFEQVIDSLSQSVMFDRSRLSTASRRSNPIKTKGKTEPSASTSMARSTAWHYTPRVRLRSLKQSEKSSLVSI
jgi:hypothetical protein